MKRIVMTLAIAASSLFAFAGQGNENVNKNVLTAFSKEFNGATEVSWSASAEYFKADFVMNNQHISAFYNGFGELMGIARNISSLNLPMSLQSKLRKEYAGYWITDLFELCNNEGTSYYVTVENADKKITLKSEGSTGWDLYKKASKL